jgi:two-component system, chemotaxis family, chemotaxis protein CheY
LSPRGTILVVDDNFEVREALSDVLVDEGYAAVGMGDGEAALDWLRGGGRPRLILLDWMMPRCDGAQFRERQLADPALAAIPVVLLTADGHADDKMASLSAQRVLKKPVALDDLLEVIETFA